MSTPPITDFRGPYRWLSNFHLASVEFEGVTYPSTEHAYQAAKCENPDLRLEFLDVTCAEAKRMGGRAQLREGWEEMKWLVMNAVCVDKFTRHPTLRAQLLDTGDAMLIEGNTWHDNYWGNCHCNTREACRTPGRNELGKILMSIRTALGGAPF